VVAKVSDAFASSLLRVLAAIGPSATSPRHDVRLHRLAESAAKEISAQGVTAAALPTNRMGRATVTPPANEERLRNLLLRGRSGEALAYETFLRETAAFLRGFLRRRLARLPDEVEDLVQETLLAVHNQRHTYDTAQPLTAWLHAIARYKLVDLLRRRSRSDALNDPIEDELEIFAVADREANDAKRDLDKLLATLPDKQRLPIVHVKIEGLSVAETAQLTGLSESAVKVGVHRGLKVLAALIRRSP
jgi:RNA polymerase sigma-70 factor (ECF subfamily)